MGLLQFQFSECRSSTEKEPLLDEGNRHFRSLHVNGFKQDYCRREIRSDVSIKYQVSCLFSHKLHLWCDNAVVCMYEHVIVCIDRHGSTTPHVMSQLILH